MRPAQEGKPVAVGHRGEEEVQGYLQSCSSGLWLASIFAKNNVSATLQRDCSLARMHKNNRIRVECAPLRKAATRECRDIYSRAHLGWPASSPKTAFQPDCSETAVWTECANTIALGLSPEPVRHHLK